VPSTGFTSVQAARGTIAFHLKALRLAGITRTRQEGTRRLVSLRLEDLDRFPGLLCAILAPPSTTPTPSA
jgi:DNA-binding transcriptional ArsR family regulator